MDPLLLLRNSIAGLRDTRGLISLVLCRTESKDRYKDEREEYNPDAKGSIFTKDFGEIDINHDHDDNIYAWDKK